MLVFDYVLILLAALLLANFINHFLPVLLVPIVQIILGGLISFVLYNVFGREIDLYPELFFVLFISPLIFHYTVTADKRDMRDMFKPIVRSAVYLVFLSTIIVGYFSHLLIPSIPLAAAFALAAALCPTDAVAVEAITKRITIPRSVTNILSGESLLNDATGIVCFQFATIALVTGSFSLLDGVTSFLVLAVGGILVGLLLTLFKYMLTRWIRTLHIETAAIHITIGLITPFIVYMVAEKLGVNGILAVFSCGMIHSLYRDKFNPETLTVNNAQKDIWSILAFNLDGLVFVILGAQLYYVLKSHIYGNYSIGGWRIAGSVLLITFALTAIRFVWWIITARRKEYNDDPRNPVGKIRSGIIFGVAGARGAVPLAIVLSIPLLLPGGAAFPQRDLIILIASGVIITSLLITNFILPLLAEQMEEDSGHNMEMAARTEILQTVIEQLRTDVTPKIQVATEIVIRNYYSRMKYNSIDKIKIDKIQNYLELHRSILLWEKDVVLRMTEMGQISKAAAQKNMDDMEELMAEKGKTVNPIQALTWSLRHLVQSLTWKDPELRGDNFVRSSPMHRDRVKRGREKLVRATHDVAAKAFHCERLLIQQKLNEGRISWKTAKDMQAKITMLEAQLQMR
ncbi:MAG: sodium:proton antiporter [Chitinispirillales bacterium]|jgi:CPA1 family monovalent cation:H+ antiporter|nr:sodium:proton antiporter [Chitinispirillales bacterium]